MEIIIQILITMAFSAFFSGMEIAFVSSNKLRFEMGRSEESITSRILSIFYHNPNNFISTMLVGNNIALVIYGILMAELIEQQLLADYINNEFLLVLTQTIISTLIILVTGEFMPKTLFKINPNFKRSRYLYCHGGDNGRISGQSFRDEVKKTAGNDWREGDVRTVAFTEEYKFGDDLLFGFKKTRVVNFDYDSKAKVFDGEVSNTRSLLGMLWSCRNERVAGARDYSKRTFLWYLWRREELNGDVAVDVFPGFTYDSKKSGGMNVSFLWRFFRYKSDPSSGTAVDIFFLPVWR